MRRPQRVFRGDQRAAVQLLRLREPAPRQLNPREHYRAHRYLELYLSAPLRSRRVVCVPSTS
jgi:hypothetical protein